MFNLPQAASTKYTMRKHFCADLYSTINILPDRSQKGDTTNPTKKFYTNKKTRKGMQLNDKHTLSPQKIFNNSSTILANH